MDHYPTLLKNYSKRPFNVIKGEGVYLFDDSGKKYLDFTSGIAVTALGHSHPKWISAINQQLSKLVHCSNLFGIPSQQELADSLVEIAGNGRLLFCNSGAEANESLIKLARLFGEHKTKSKDQPKFEIITASNAFHGRTFGCMAATPKNNIQNGFHPMLPGFKHAKFNDIESFKSAFSPSVCAVMIETIQGEGGIYPANQKFLQELEALCKTNDCLLIIDEVQCGICRTGDFFAYEESGIKPDAIGMAKGLGGGFPIGAIWVDEKHGDLFQPGSHGTTFGGNPLACEAGKAVLSIIKEENLKENVKSNSPQWFNALKDLQQKYPDEILDIRGRGYMVGISVKDSLKITEKARAKGLLLVPAGQSNIRLLPPLIASKKELKMSIDILSEIFKNL